ncbi:hypothetical protein BOTBODRAFT_45871 [Botryobasidium botryosum FD-172 SS1]|uniref:Homeobox domain-containing protein n=1 Tax=Botryobasidium botryosum (strain FD-172 SS1) TaxID=930990 RepID=A0A067MK32_BOTB1|nr:hypothetical protein BOTBODRAFT_45871 [Botryobasidium botryosum FD-172 SS1]
MPPIRVTSPYMFSRSSSSTSTSSSSTVASTAPSPSPASPPGEIRPRTRITPAQLHALESLYLQITHPSRDAREKVAEDIGLELKTVTIWFQNKRQSARRSFVARIPAVQYPHHAHQPHSPSSPLSRSKPTLDAFADRSRSTRSPARPSRLTLEWACERATRSPRASHPHPHVHSHSRTYSHSPSHSHSHSQLPHTHSHSRSRSMSILDPNGCLSCDDEKGEPDADITDTLSLGSAFLEGSGEDEMQAALALCGLLRG